MRKSLNADKTLPQVRVAKDVSAIIKEVARKNNLYVVQVLRFAVTYAMKHDKEYSDFRYSFIWGSGVYLPNLQADTRQYNWINQWVTVRKSQARVMREIYTLYAYAIRDDVTNGEMTRWQAIQTPTEGFFVKLLSLTLDQQN